MFPGQVSTRSMFPPCGPAGSVVGVPHSGAVPRQPSIGAYGMATESLQWMNPSRIGQTCVPWGQSVPSHSHSCFGSAVLVAHWPSVGRISPMVTARQSPGSAPSTQIGPVSGLL